MEEDKKRVELLLKKFNPRILRLAVNFISFDSSVQELRDYLKEHKNFHPDQRELFHTLCQLEEPELKELVILSENIATKGYDLNKIIPLY
jgi:hypothetical protein